MKLLLPVCFLAFSAAILPLMSTWPGAVSGGAILLVLLLLIASLSSHWLRRVAAVLMAQADGVDSYFACYRAKRREYRESLGVE